MTSNNDYYSSRAYLTLPFEPEINNTNWYQYDYFDAKKALNHYQRNFDELYWICSELPRKSTPCINRIGELLQAPQSWVVGNSCSGGPPGWCDQSRWPVMYCLSERAELQCKLHFNQVIAVIVTILNFCKSSFLVMLRSCRLLIRSNHPSYRIPRKRLTLDQSKRC